METEPQEITNLVGREVYSTNGVYVGQVEDVKLDFDAEHVTGLALHKVNGDLLDARLDGHRGVMVPYRWIQAVGDVILVSDVVEQLSSSDEDDDEAA